MRATFAPYKAARRCMNHTLMRTTETTENGANTDRACDASTATADEDDVVLLMLWPRDWRHLEYGIRRECSRELGSRSALD